MFPSFFHLSAFVSGGGVIGLWGTAMICRDYAIAMYVFITGGNYEHKSINDKVNIYTHSLLLLAFVTYEDFIYIREDN